MVENNPNIGLIDTLRGLYSKMASRAWSKRLQNHRRDGVVEIDITADLFDRIHQLKQAHPDKPPAVEVTTSSPTVPSITHPEPSTPHQSPERSPTTSAEPGALSEYFESGRADSELIPELGAELRKRTWEHIHTALRMARQGDVDAAKLHAVLANAAFAEAAHYMTNDDTVEFATKIKNKLSILRT